MRSAKEKALRLAVKKAEARVRASSAMLYKARKAFLKLTCGLQPGLFDARSYKLVCCVCHGPILGRHTRAVMKSSGVVVGDLHYGDCPPVIRV